MTNKKFKEISRPVKTNRASLKAVSPYLRLRIYIYTIDIFRRSVGPDFGQLICMFEMPSVKQCRDVVEIVSAC